MTTPIRVPTSPLAQRKPLIADILLSPPPLDMPLNNDDVSQFLLLRGLILRNPSILLYALLSHMEFQDVLLADLVEPGKLISIQSDMLYADAFEKLSSHNLTLLPILDPTEDPAEHDMCLTFDYTDINTYLLMVLNKIKFSVPELDTEFYGNIAKARAGGSVPVKFAAKLNHKVPLGYFKQRQETLARAMEVLGSGVHRIAIVDNSHTITGILSQRRLIKYLWEHGRQFLCMDPLFPQPINELGIGLLVVVLVHGDQPLIDALTTMHEHKMLSVAVVDRKFNLVGNISAVDVKHVLSSNNSHLLLKLCLHFISYILSARGLENGQDVYPIFHVHPNTSLGRVMAKLVATKAHRLWIVKPPAPQHSHSGSGAGAAAGPGSVPASPLQPLSALPMEPLSSVDLELVDGLSIGKLVGVVSIADVLSLVVHRTAGKRVDPSNARKQRRQLSASISSSSTVDDMRRSVEVVRGVRKE